MSRVLIVLSFAALTACGQATDAVNSDVTPLKLERATADYFGTGAYSVQVSNIKQSVLGSSYRAHVSGRAYNCRYFRSAVTCQYAS